MGRAFGFETFEDVLKNAVPNESDDYAQNDFYVISVHNYYTMAFV